jgi:hypothetical protein
MVIATRYERENPGRLPDKPGEYSLQILQRKIQAAKLAIDDELGRATDMKFRLKLVITANSLRNLEEQILSCEG